MIGIAPATLASNLRSTPIASAASNSSAPLAASSSLFAVTTGLPRRSASRMSVRAGSIPPITSITTSTSGSRTLVVLRTATRWMWTGSPARSRISSACSVRSLATPVPTTPQPSMPTLIGSTCRSPPSTRTRAAAPGRGRPSPRRPRIDPRWPRTGRPTSCLTHPPPGTPFPPPSSLGAWPQPSLAPRCPSLATLVNTFTFSEADARVVTTQTAPLAPERALLDDVLPRYEAREVHEILVGAPQADVYRALEGLTLGEVSLFRVLMGVRALPARLARSRRRPAGSARPRMLDPDVRLLDWGLRGFTVLAQRPGSELVIGGPGQPWRLAGGVSARVGSLAEFRAFDRPGFAKLAL